MKNKKNHASLVITGAATAFVGLAGTVQAIPVSIHSDSAAWGTTVRVAHNRSDAGRTTRLTQNDPFISNHPGGRYSIQPGDLGNYTPSPAAYLSTRHNFWPWQRHAVILGVLPRRISPAAGNAPVSGGVPDDGTTAMMLGGVFCGFVCLKKNWKPEPAA